MQDKLLIIFYKNPELGKVKTRLAAETGEEAALKIYKYLSSKIIRNSIKVKTDKMLFYSRFIDRNDQWSENIFIKEIQSGKTLGERMHNAFKIGFATGYKKICIIGTDIVDLSNTIIEEAFDYLSTNDYVIGPAKDGGYYLLGMKQLNKKLFTKKQWSSESIYKDTVADISTDNKTMYKLKELTDIDILNDLTGYDELLEIIDSEY